MHIIKLFASIIYVASQIYYKVSKNVYSSYKQIFNKNEGLHNRGYNGKIVGYKIATLKWVIISNNSERSYRPSQLSNFIQQD